MWFLTQLSMRKLCQVLCMIQFFVINPNETLLSSNMTSHQIYHLTVPRLLEISTWLIYPLVVSSSLLLAYLVALTVKWGYSRSKLVQGWMRRLTGKSPKEEKMLLHTLPYYLAITRSSCEVSWKKISFSDSKLSWQAYVLNLPIGHKITNVARDAVKLRDFKWKLNELNKRWWKTWVSRSNLCIF